MFRYPSCNLSTYDRREFPGGTVYNGDCLDVIKTLPESSWTALLPTLLIFSE